MAIDPIEKKPLYHFHPGSTILSAGPNGCSFKCKFCQNYEVSQKLIPFPEIPEISAKTIIQNIIESNSIGIAYTYTEPSIWYETIMDLSSKVKEEGLLNVMVSNGFINPLPLSYLVQMIDAMNIDIKSMNPDFYKRLCKGDLKPVLDTCIKVKKDCHLEISHLMITGENDSEQETINLVKFIEENLGKDTPLHISKYYPRYKLHNKETSDSTLLNAYKIAGDRLDYVYIDNAGIKGGGNMYCPKCSTLLIDRDNYKTEITEHVRKDKLNNTTCNKCKHIFKGIKWN